MVEKKALYLYFTIKVTRNWFDDLGHFLIEKTARPVTVILLEKIDFPIEKTKYFWDVQKSPTSKNSWELETFSILIFFFAKQSSRSLVYRKIKSGVIPSSRTAEKSRRIFFIGKFPDPVPNYLEREIFVLLLDDFLVQGWFKSILL